MSGLLLSTACTTEPATESTSVGDGGSGGARGDGGSGGQPLPQCELVDYDDPAAFTTEPVSFATDLMPLFQSRCTGNGTSCHSTQDPSPLSQLVLSPQPGVTLTQTHADAAHANLVGAAAFRASLSRVVPGDPAASFLLIKLEYATPASCLPDGASCTSNCGQGMPIGDDPTPLTESQRSILRTWIRNGAPNN